MADNTQLGAPSGTGDNISTDDLGTVKVQRVKVQFGADGSAADVSTGNPLPVGDGGGSLTVDNGGTFAVQAALTSTTNAGATAKTSDYDTGAGTDTVTSFGIALPASGGAVQGGTSSNPVRTDPTGTTTQPVSGTVTANAGSGTMAVSGTVTANAGSGTLAVSAASLPLPSGAATSAKQPALGTAGSASSDVLTVQGIASMTALKVDGSAVTQPVSAASLPLPSGAATSAKQPALGTAGSASTDVLTVQGIASMTALKTDGSGVTQPVSGSVVVTGVSSNVTVQGSGIGLGKGSSNNAYQRIKYANQTTTVQTVKGSAGVLAGYIIWNPNTSVAYVQIFDTTSAVTLGTTVPDIVLPIPAGSAANMFSDVGVAMTTGIKLACTTTATGLTAPTTGLDMTIFYG